MLWTICDRALFQRSIIDMGLRQFPNKSEWVCFWAGRVDGLAVTRTLPSQFSLKFVHITDNLCTREVRAF